MPHPILISFPNFASPTSTPFAEREDLINQTNQEIAVLQEYLPKQLTREEIKGELEKIIAEIGATTMKDMGAIMKEAKTKMGASADGKTINEVAKEIMGL